MPMCHSSPTAAVESDVAIYQGDVREVLTLLPPASVNCCVTSPPYWGLRDYGCGGQIGLEPTPAAYVETMVQVFREVWRVLKDDGTCWLNLGDSHASTTGANGGHQGKTGQRANRSFTCETRSAHGLGGLKPKDLCGIPWRVALALQADGWYLRSDIIWAKPNPMPESTKDRPTRSHEYVFLLTKAARYWYDAEAIAEPLAAASAARYSYKFGGAKSETLAAADKDGMGVRTRVIGERDAPETRNARDVWTITPKPFREAHFATFPPELARRCILAGCPAGSTVLDPFSGAGTVAVVARELGRNAIGIELNPGYIEMTTRRLAATAP